MLLLIYAFVGFESVLVTAGETEKPRRTIPNALVRTVIFTAAFYFERRDVPDYVNLGVASPARTPPRPQPHSAGRPRRWASGRLTEVFVSWAVPLSKEIAAVKNAHRFPLFFGILVHNGVGLILQSCRGGMYML